MNFYNQSCKKDAKGKIVEGGDWQDVCNGHATLDAAHTCAAACQAAYKGQQVREDIMSTDTRRMIHLFGAMYEVMGFTLHNRIVKRTDEVIYEEV